MTDIETGAGPFGHPHPWDMRTLLTSFMLPEGVTRTFTPYGVVVTHHYRSTIEVTHSSRDGSWCAVARRETEGTAPQENILRQGVTLAEAMEAAREALMEREVHGIEPSWPTSMKQRVREAHAMTEEEVRELLRPQLPLELREETKQRLRELWAEAGVASTHDYPNS